MKNLFIESGINLTDEQVEQFILYRDLLKEYNEKFNITAITDDTEIVKKHFIDSLMGNSLLEGESLIDIGSGGGFPAIPIKITNPNLKVTLLEATEKKCSFLRIVIEKLNLKNINVVNGRAEELAKNINFREKFDMCSARAVARLNTLSEYCMPFVKKGGYFISFKGDYEEELREASTAISVLGGKLKEVKAFELFDFKRGIIKIEKIKNTPNQYPRGRGKERKNPL